MQETAFTIPFTYIFFNFLDSLTNLALIFLIEKVGLIDSER